MIAITTDPDQGAMDDETELEELRGAVDNPTGKLVGIKATHGTSNLEPHLPHLQSESRDTSVLTLPGELRNRIYEYCTNGSPLTMTHQSGLRDNTRQFRGLTQTCRQIREEYRPLYMSRNVMKFHDIKTLQGYVGDFYISDSQLTQATEDVRGHYTGDLIVFVTNDWGLNLDIQRILIFVADFPSVRCRFMSFRGGSIQASRLHVDEVKVALSQLNGLLELVASSPPWHEFVRAVLTRASITIFSSSTRLSLDVAEDAEKWNNILKDWWYEKCAISEFSVYHRCEDACKSRYVIHLNNVRDLK
ncbi:hypothetical protein T440DRAFT_558398 [Plenodomus tracheiphilus IPT5]|uniref:F-box domain-containing protein n=1 Tax=Plenodomus tracheiphilus IPT5 TaxID=1408161 RepID=A0A6A7AU08_9PLEO|nr:hypothetical protein T440DRAFT_558398 [Plenodomus tracheiphilus IPT5]